MEGERGIENLENWCTVNVIFFALLTVAANKRLIQFMKGKKSDNSMLAFPVLMSIDSGFYDNEKKNQ